MCGGEWHEIGLERSQCLLKGAGEPADADEGVAGKPIALGAIFDQKLDRRGKGCGVGRVGGGFRSAQRLVDLAEVADMSAVYDRHAELGRLDRVLATMWHHRPAK